MELDIKKVKRGTKVSVKKVKDNSVMVFLFNKVGYKHTFFTMIYSSPKHVAEGCGYYSLKSKLNEWFSGGADTWNIINVIY